MLETIIDNDTNVKWIDNYYDFFALFKKSAINYDIFCVPSGIYLIEFIAINSFLSQMIQWSDKKIANSSKTRSSIWGKTLLDRESFYDDTISLSLYRGFKYLQNNQDDTIIFSLGWC